MLGHAVRFHDARMGVENLAEASARLHRLLAGGERLAAGGMQFQVTRAGTADQDGAHEGDVIEAEDAGELERDLVLCVEPAPAGLGSAEERVAPRAEDE